ncbi:hypothetical protein NG798_23840 [Ancylothrix sp. C2]|uniref:hypothetical protein n=1 Tax=Ancylothrix sp. D3o TaxID=2953691 RepID=UPI0021BB2CEA|nr:hypothetical protein [Ancylothrix sp. D3o]MCT7952837.1 hypothetical protein [Ancylothrix sp. D3o]
MVSEEQEMVFDIIITLKLQLLKEAKKLGEKYLPVFHCPQEHAEAFCEYLLLPKNRNIFRENKIFPIIQTVESQHEKQESIKDAFLIALLLTSLIIKENPHLSPAFLKSLLLEANEMSNRYTGKELASFIERYIGFLAEDLEGKINRADFN